MGVGGMLACFRNKLPLVGGVVKLHLKEAGGGRESGGQYGVKLSSFSWPPRPPCTPRCTLSAVSRLIFLNWGVTNEG